jgi:hypothetical protein
MAQSQSIDLKENLSEISHRLNICLHALHTKLNTGQHPLETDFAETGEASK